jgi:hypothetical protein
MDKVRKRVGRLLRNLGMSLRLAGADDPAIAVELESENAAKGREWLPRGIQSVLRAKRPDVATTRLARWRERYLKARTNAVGGALERLQAADCADDERAALVQLLSDTEADAVTEALVRRSERAKLPLLGAASFRRSLAMRTRRSQLTRSGPEWRLNNKERGYHFVAARDIPHPEIFEHHVRHDDLVPRTGTVVKPVDGAGARGVYLVFDRERVFEPKRNRWLGGWSQMSITMKEDLASGTVTRDRWLMESLVFEDETEDRPGRDLKFYCFYGRVGLVLEVTRWGETAYCEWNEAGRQVLTGKYDARRFEGEGATAGQIQVAEMLSGQIPSPFIRIDFLRAKSADKGMVFCEFTPRPGNFHRFNPEFDRLLGEYYLEAEARLQQDLLEGRRFDAVFNRVPRKKARKGSKKRKPSR